LSSQFLGSPRISSATSLPTIMKLSHALTVLFLPIIVNAQSAAGNQNTISVIVSPAGALTYSPSSFSAANGSSVTFTFPQSVAHSVTQSTFESPCAYLAPANGSSGGFDSGVQTSKLFTITITNDQEPIWFFCKAQKHCGLGMVGSVNAPPSAAAAYLAAALAVGANASPLPYTGPVTGGVNGVATSTPTASSASPATSSTSKSSDAGRLVASGVFALLATAFGITLA